MDKYNKDYQIKFNIAISGFCAYFRKNVIRMTLNEMSEKCNIPVSTISNFEQGRSSNLRFVYLYLVSCETWRQKDIFINSLGSILERSYNYD